MRRQRRLPHLARYQPHVATLHRLIDHAAKLLYPGLPDNMPLHVHVHRPRAARSTHPAASAEVRSDRRWRTARLATPWARDSFQDAWSQRATPRLARIAHASSTTKKAWPAGPRSRDTAACSHAVAHAMSTPSAPDA